jgi:hypothetical protein
MPRVRRASAWLLDELNKVLCEDESQQDETSIQTYRAQGWEAFDSCES